MQIQLFMYLHYNIIINFFKILLYWKNILWPRRNSIGPSGLAFFVKRYSQDVYFVDKSWATISHTSCEYFPSNSFISKSRILYESYTRSVTDRRPRTCLRSRRPGNNIKQKKLAPKGRLNFAITSKVSPTLIILLP